MAKNPQSASKRATSVWQMMRDVLIESMRRGQLPLICFLFIVMLFLWKTPSDYYPTLWGKIFELRGSILCGSLALNLVLVFGWYFNAKGLRRRFKYENERIVSERNELQKKLGAPIKSSD
jgi:hypothetical protein